MYKTKSIIPLKRQSAATVRTGNRNMQADSLVGSALPHSYYALYPQSKNSVNISDNTRSRRKQEPKKKK